MKTRRVPLIIGLVLALGTAVLLMTYLMSLRPSASASLTRAVLVATHDIPARVATTPDLFTLEQRNVSQLDSDAISDPKALDGNFTLVAIPAGSVVTHSKIGAASAATIPAKLPVGMLAVSIAIDNVKGVAGLITPGDRVDVIAVPPAGGTETPRGYAIVRDALVLAMGDVVQTTNAFIPGQVAAATPPVPTTVTLALTPDQVDLVEGADVSSTLRLALRNPNEPKSAFPAEPLVVRQGGDVGNVAANPAPIAPFTLPKLPDLRDDHTPPAAAGPVVIDGDRVGTTTSK